MPHATAQIVIKKENEMINKYIEIVERDNVNVAKFIRQVIDAANMPTYNERLSKYIEIEGEFFKESSKITVYMQEYAKTLYIARAVRKVLNSVFFSTIKLENNTNNSKHPVADVFEYVLDKMQEQGVSPENAAEFFNSNALAMFSLTPHPTNATGVEFTRLIALFEKRYTESTDFESDLEQNGVSLENTGYEKSAAYLNILTEIYNVRLAEGKKTTINEMQETILSLDSIYDSIWPVRQSLANALQKYPQYAEFINQYKIMVKPSVWACGDGDGNPNANTQALKDGIVLLRDSIVNKYIGELNKLGLADIAERLNYGDYANPDDLIIDVANYTEVDTSELIYKIRTFGLHYATIDLRHNANDIMLTLTSLVAVADIFVDDFLNLPELKQRLLLTKWFNDKTIIKRLAEIDCDKLANETAKRILGRLKVIAEYPEMCEKLIIAENKTASNALAAMLLLRASGNKVAEAGSNIDIVTLSESVEDLLELPNVIWQLLESKEYRQHVAERGYIMPMIAKSDTVRRGGRGAEINQNLALGEVYGMLPEIITKYPELEGIKICGYNGGGAALQRGGGCITEVGHIHGNLARIFGDAKQYPVMGPSTLTIQGHQGLLLFSPTLVAMNTLEAFIAQNWYAAMQTVGLLKVREVANYDDVQESYEVFAKMSAQWQKEYRLLVGDPDNKKTVTGNQAFNILYKNAPWVSVVLNNLSSRPSKRGADESNMHPSVKDLRGNNPKLLDNRAITVERLTAHSGLLTLTYLGMMPGLFAFKDNLHDIYENCKLMRDAMRITAVALHMIDFEHAWFMLVGYNRPTNFEDIIVKANEFNAMKYYINNDKLTNDQEKELNAKTLAWLEVTALKTALLIRRAIMGHPVNANSFDVKRSYRDLFTSELDGGWQELQDWLAKNPDFTLRTPLQEGWPELAAQLEHRESYTEFARYIEALMTLNLHNDPEQRINSNFQYFMNCVYAACDLLNAPDGGLNLPLTRCNQLHRPFVRSVSSDSLGAISSNSSLHNIVRAVSPFQDDFKTWQDYVQKSQGVVGGRDNRF